MCDFTHICNRRPFPTQGTSSTLSSPSSWHHLIPALWRVEGSVLEDPGNGFRRKMQPDHRARAATTSQEESAAFQNRGMICCFLLVVTTWLAGTSVCQNSETTKPESKPDMKGSNGPYHQDTSAEPPMIAGLFLT